MIKSMTGYGRAESGQGGQKLTAEVRTVNHRFAEFNLRLPKELAFLEPSVKELLQKRIPRGSVTVTVSANSRESERLATLDHAKAEYYLEQLKALKKTYGLKGSVDLRTLIALPDVISFKVESAAPDESWEQLSAVLDAALKSLEEMR
ncbi:MAG: YicC/YloC family endoribonuclease, partial [Candidatus Edwardsbacteria bacterium]|nr:YicC/YloC family endoribonuclease [Candidatus Edwardsbacteria bacterium]